MRAAGMALVPVQQPSLLRISHPRSPVIYISGNSTSSFQCRIFHKPSAVSRDSSFKTHHSGRKINFQRLCTSGEARASCRGSVSDGSLLHGSQYAHRIVLGLRLPCRVGYRKGSSKRRVMASGQPQAEAWEALSEDNEAGGAVRFNSISDFTRFCEKDNNGAELQTAIVSYCRPYPPKPFPLSFFLPKQEVDLVAAVHIADKEYFVTLQKELASYDCVLYEMVADKNSGWHRTKYGKLKWRPKWRSSRNRGFNIIALVQRIMARILMLDFQLECMDYQGDNWYHADLDYGTFKKLQQERGENFFKFARDLTKISMKTISRNFITRADLDPLRLKLLWAARAMPMPLLGSFLIEGVCAPSNAPLFKSPEVKALFNLELVTAAKLFLAKNLTSQSNDAAVSVLEKSVIIGERNKIAMQELDKVLKDGHKRIAIFYGSGHLPDMDRRLQKEFGFHPTKIHWQTAWSMKCRKTSMQAGIFSLLKTLADVSGWPLNRYQTLALVLFSVILAVDLWFWELFFSSLHEYTQQLVEAIGQILEKGWT